ncbi:MAG TPA: ABC transporter permease [Acidimicrobiia bacterium]|nr:ABC transporter permease [Acidimicrobiia bacterium]
MSKILAIASSNVRRLLRERSNIFFVFIFPIALILLIGAQFGGDFAPGVGVFQADDDPLADAITEEIQSEDSLAVTGFESSDELTEAVERGTVQAGVAIPAGVSGLAEAGTQVEVEFLARPDGAGPQLQSIVSAAVARVMTPVAAAQFGAEKTESSFDEALTVARSQTAMAPGLEVETTAVGDALFPSTLGRFDLGAAQQLVLFTFLTALAGSAALILTRKLGVSRRMLSTPTSTGTIVSGEGAGRWAVAMVQGLYIIAVTYLLFRVDWGDPLGALLILVAFSAVGAGAGMLMGAVFSNDQQAGGIGVVVSLGLAALGGCMLPIELFSPTMTRVAHLTPHAWALDGFAELVRRDGTVADILPELGVLTVYAAVLLVLAGWRLRQVLTRP